MATAPKVDDSKLAQKFGTLLTVRQAAQICNMSTTRIRELIKTGKLPCIILGPRGTRIRESVLKRFIDAHSYGS